MPNRRDITSPPPGITDLLRDLLESSGIGQNIRDIYLLPDIADEARRFWLTNFIGQNAREMRRLVSGRLVLWGFSMIIPKFEVIGPCGTDTPDNVSICG